jgi:hypothetical protein
MIKKQAEFLKVMNQIIGDFANYLSLQFSVYGPVKTARRCVQR